jgi:hypothetical protein
MIGMPPFDQNKLVHGEQSFEVINPWPVAGGSFIAQKSCTGVFDKGSGMVIEQTVDIYGEQDKKLYSRLVGKSFVRGYGGWNVSLYLYIEILVSDTYLSFVM